MLSVKQLRAWYQKEEPVLTDVSLGLNANEVVGLIGLNGAGKTTFLRLLSGLMNDFQAEEICWCGNPMKPRDKEFKKCRYTVFSEDTSFAYFTFWEYVSYVFASYGKAQPEMSDLIRGFHFEEYTDVLLKDLSMGNRRKVFLITAFALKPSLLLLDEPVNGLDFQSTEFLYEQISGYKKYGTLLFSSHILESITLTSDRVFVLEEGQIRYTFEQEEICAERIREVLRIEGDV